MTEQRDAEAWARGYAATGVGHPEVGVLLAELDRLRTRLADTLALTCPRSCYPPCEWTGPNEAALVEHYITVHHSPTQWAYDQACKALAATEPVVTAARKLANHYRDRWDAVDDTWEVQLGTLLRRLDHAVDEWKRSLGMETR